MKIYKITAASKYLGISIKWKSLKEERSFMLDGKYEIRYNRLFKIGTDTPIPEDEPVFIFRARDIHLPAVLCHYATMCNLKTQHDNVLDWVKNIIEWQRDNAMKLKEPDC